MNISRRRVRGSSQPPLPFSGRRDCEYADETGIGGQIIADPACLLLGKRLISIVRQKCRTRPRKGHRFKQRILLNTRLESVAFLSMAFRRANARQLIQAARSLDRKGPPHPSPLPKGRGSQAETAATAFPLPSHIRLRIWQRLSGILAKARLREMDRVRGSWDQILVPLV